MKISLIHPSRSRPQQAAATAKSWLSSAKFPENIEYIFSVDSDDKEVAEYLYLIPESAKMRTHDNRSAIEAINHAATHATGDLLIVVSDDFACPFHWDAALLSMLEGRSDFIVKTQDGAQPWIITLPIMDRVYYERFGYIYYPEFLHMFCDTEMTHVGHLLGKVIELPITFKHNHYTTGRTAKDAVNVKNDATWNQGEKLYLERVMRNFDLPVEDCVQPKIHPQHLRYLMSKGITYVK